jgi:hypothetical protein
MSTDFLIDNAITETLEFMIVDFLYTMWCKIGCGKQNHLYAYFHIHVYIATIYQISSGGMATEINSNTGVVIWENN